MSLRPKLASMTTHKQLPLKYRDEDLGSDPQETHKSLWPHSMRANRRWPGLLPGSQKVPI